MISWTPDDGETEVNNLCILCRYHHTLLHLEMIELPDWVGSRRPVGARST